MKLTGKCKEDFEKWYLKQDNFDDYYITYVPSKGMLDDFKCIPFSHFPNSFQYGVYVDFFDSVEIEIGNESRNNYHIFTEKECYFDTEEWNYLDINNLPNRTKAIEKANEIYNEKQ